MWYKPLKYNDLQHFLLDRFNFVWYSFSAVCTESDSFFAMSNSFIRKYQDTVLVMLFAGILKICNNVVHAHDDIVTVMGLIFSSVIAKRVIDDK